MNDHCDVHPCAPLQGDSLWKSEKHSPLQRLYIIVCGCRCGLLSMHNLLTRQTDLNFHPVTTNTTATIANTTTELTAIATQRQLQRFTHSLTEPLDRRWVVAPSKHHVHWQRSRLSVVNPVSAISCRIQVWRGRQRGRRSPLLCSTVVRFEAWTCVELE